MGGGRYSQRFNTNYSELEETAKKALRDAAPPAKRNVFISFAHEDLNTVNLLRAQAKNENSELEFADYSVREPFDSANAEYVRRGIRERLRQASVTVVYVSDATAGSAWVDWEIRESQRLGKGIIAVFSGDAAPRSLPTALSEYGITPVRWSGRQVTEAIESAAQDRGPTD